jgi:hypothetical protein
MLCDRNIKEINMRFALTFANVSPLSKTIVWINAQNESNARLYAKTFFGHLWAGIYPAEGFKTEPYYTNQIEAATSAEEGIRRAFEMNWLQAVPRSIMDHEGEDE